MEYQVCQGVDFTELAISCRGGMAGMCWPYEITEEREVCGAWRTNEPDAYASFYTTRASVTDCDAPGNSCVEAVPSGSTKLRTHEAGALKSVGANEKSVGDSILGIFKVMWESFKKTSGADQPMIWD